MKPRYDEEVRRVTERVVVWTALLGLEGLGLTVTHHFTDALSDEHDRVAAITEADWEYRQATITWYLPVTITMSEDELDRLIVHEHVHVLVSPIESALSAVARNNGKNEFAVESVARVILNVAGSPSPYRGTS